MERHWRWTAVGFALVALGIALQFVAIIGRAL